MNTTFLLATFNITSTLEEDQNKTYHLTLSPNSNSKVNQLYTHLPHLFNEINQKEWQACCLEFENLINSSDELKKSLDKCEKIQIRAFKNGSFAIYAKSRKIPSSEIDNLSTYILNSQKQESATTLKELTEKRKTESAPLENVKRTFMKALENQKTLHRLDKLERLAIRSVKNAKSGAKVRKKGKLKLKTQLNDNWSRMYHKIKEIDGDLSPEARKKIRFFLIQYLAKVACCNIPETRTTRFFTSPIQQASHSGVYFRDNNRQNFFIAALENLIQHEFYPNSDHTMHLLSDAHSFINGIQRIKPICPLTVDDTDTQIVEKLTAAFDANRNDFVGLYFDIPNEWIDQLTFQSKFEDFVEKIQELRPSKYVHCESYILGIGKKGDLDFILLDNSHMSDLIKGLRSSQGYMPTLQQAARLFSNFTISFEDLFQAAGITVASLDKIDASSNLGFITPQVIPSMGKVPSLGGHFISSFDDFIKDPAIIAFSRFIERENQPKAISILCTNILKYIDGMKKYPLDESFQKMGLTSFLEESYIRVLNYLEVIMTLDPSHNLFNVTLANYHNLIFEELFLWTDNAIDSEFANKALKHILQNKVLLGASLRPSVSFMVNSGVRCATTIRKAFQNMHGNQFNTFCFEDSYFEIVGASKYLKNVSIIQFPDLNKDFQENLEKLKKSNQRLDLIFVDPQGSLNTNFPIMTSHNVSDIIADALLHNEEQSSLTVAMDLTIAKINDETIAQALNKFRDKIEAGHLNVILFRSIQKFDSFGTDKLSGGYLQLYSQNKEFIDTFEKIAAIEERDVDPINKKGLLHLYENCLEGLDQYRQASFDSAKYFYERINPDFIYPSKSEFIYPSEVTKNSDMPFYVGSRINVNNLFFVAIHVKNERTFSQFFNFLKELGGMQRSSFGFSHLTSNSSSGDGPESVFRICFGLEEKWKIDIVADRLNEFLAFKQEYGGEFNDKINADKEVLILTINFIADYLKVNPSKLKKDLIYSTFIPELIFYSLEYQFFDIFNFLLNEIIEHDPSCLDNLKNYLDNKFDSEEILERILHILEREVLASFLKFNFDLLKFSKNGLGCNLLMLAIYQKKVDLIPILIGKLFQDASSKQIDAFFESSHFLDIISQLSDQELLELESGLKSINSSYIKPYLNLLDEAKLKFKESRILRENLSKTLNSYNENINLTLFEQDFDQNQIVFKQLLDLILHYVVQIDDVFRARSLNFGKIPISPLWAKALTGTDIFPLL